MTELLPAVHRRRSPRGGGVEVLGDAEPLGLWLDRVGFGRPPGPFRIALRRRASPFRPVRRSPSPGS